MSGYTLQILLLSKGKPGHESNFPLHTVYSGDSAEDRTVSSNIEAGKPISSLSEMMGAKLRSWVGTGYMDGHNVLETTADFEDEWWECRREG